MLVLPSLLGTVILAAVCAGEDLAETCSNCLLVAKALESELVKIEPAFSPSAGGIFGQRRRLSHPRSEVQIFDTIDATCEKVNTLQPSLASTCRSLVSRHREALEELVFDAGPSKVRYKLCTELEGLCRPHALHDSGEL